MHHWPTLCLHGLLALHGDQCLTLQLRLLGTLLRHAALQRVAAAQGLVEQLLGILHVLHVLHLHTQRTSLA